MNAETPINVFALRKPMLSPAPPPPPPARRPTLVRFTRGTGFPAAIVRWFTWSRFAHVGYLLPDDTILDATPEFGVAIREWKRSDDDASTEYYVLDVPPECLAAAIMWGATQVGKPYDWPGIFGFITHRDWHKDSAWFCSEFLVETTVKGGIPMLSFQEMEVDRITPPMVRLSVLLQPYFWEIKTAGEAA